MNNSAIATLTEPASGQFIETGCTVELQGVNFSANGAWQVGDKIACYAKGPADRPETREWTPLSGWTFTDWKGNQIGTGRVNSTWRVGPYRTKMYSFLIRLPDGRQFYGRGQGDGMIVTGKLLKRKSLPNPVSV